MALNFPFKASHGCDNVFRNEANVMHLVAVIVQVTDLFAQLIQQPGGLEN